MIGNPFASLHRFLRRTRSESGANVVESAVIVSVLFMFLLGILEGSLLMTNRSNIKSSVNLALRAGSVAANDPDADFQILTDLNKLLSDQVGTVRYAIVYNANSSTNGAPPASCVTAANSGGNGVAGLCNVYTNATVRSPVAANFGYDATSNPTATADLRWPARGRAATYSGGRDQLGLYVASTLRSITGLIPRTEMQSFAVVRLEARGV